jgi:hypothetical protein
VTFCVVKSPCPERYALFAGEDGGENPPPTRLWPRGLASGLGFYPWPGLLGQGWSFWVLAGVLGPWTGVWGHGQGFVVLDRVFEVLGRVLGAFSGVWWAWAGVFEPWLRYLGLRSGFKQKSPPQKRAGFLLLGPKFREGLNLSLKFRGRGGL